MAAAAYGTYEAAGKETGRDATTVKRHVEQLEAWLRKVLVTDDVPLSVTRDGDDFVVVAQNILALIDEADLKQSLNRTRVQADGAITIEGVKLGSSEARAIGTALVGSRAFLDPNYVVPPKISGRDIII
jgi:DNA-binding transcriptional LysR family regulator